MNGQPTNPKPPKHWSLKTVKKKPKSSNGVPGTSPKSGEELASKKKKTQKRTKMKEENRRGQKKTSLKVMRKTKECVIKSKSESRKAVLVVD